MKTILTVPLILISLAFGVANPPQPIHAKADEHSEQVIAYLDENYPILSPEQAVHMALVAFQAGDTEIPYRLMQDITDVERGSVDEVLIEVCQAGGTALLEVHLDSIENASFRQDRFELMIVALCNFGYHTDAYELVEKQEWLDDKSDYVDRVLRSAYVMGNDEEFPALLARAGKGAGYRVRVADELSERRLKIESFANERQNLVGSKAWDEVLLTYRLGRIVFLKTEQELDQHILLARSADDLARLWFCWGAIAAKDGRNKEVERALSVIQQITAQEPDVGEDWQPELLFLAARAGSKKLVSSKLDDCTANNRQCLAALAAAVELKLYSEAKRYLSVFPSISLEQTEICAVLSQRDNEFLKQLPDELIRMRILARSLLEN